MMADNTNERRLEAFLFIINVKMVEAMKAIAKMDAGTDLIDEHLVPSSTTGESTVFYYKMKGDYYHI
ncbi:hypothetical protein HAX54_021616 [Datura stramonium]|uniref:14-3-3 domain-containing protein n=1 Tax=Datura stramonium TaxID=4076 RepID=A0ABS8UUL1_DATST|nr:hypothetical protein [Datura stramonium]